jgi:uncharacterized protein CbrC (UPF0167 family)
LKWRFAARRLVDRGLLSRIEGRFGCRYAILIPKSALTDFEGLRKQASELAQKSSAFFWWAAKDTEIAFCFERHGAAISFKIHCINYGIPNRSEW